MKRQEQETVILFNEEEKEASVYTHNKSLINKLLGLCKKYPEEYKLKTEDEHSKTFKIPKRYITIRQPRTLTQEQKEKLQENVKKARESKGNIA